MGCAVSLRASSLSYHKIGVEKHIHMSLEPAGQTKHESCSRLELTENPLHIVGVISGVLLLALSARFAYKFVIRGCWGLGVVSPELNSAPPNSAIEPQFWLGVPVM